MSLYPFPVAHLQPAAEDSPILAGQELWLDGLRPGSLWKDPARTMPAGEFETVASWYDPTSNQALTQATSAARGLNLGTGIELDGADDCMTGLNLPIHTWPGLTVITVFVTGAAIPSYQMVAGLYQSGQARWALGPCGDGSYRQGWAGTGANVPLPSPSAAYAPLTGYVTAYRKSASAWNIRRGSTDGSAIADTSFPTAAAALTIGCEDTGMRNYFLAGEVRMLLVYPFVLTDGELSTVVSWAAARHSV